MLVTVTTPNGLKDNHLMPTELEADVTFHKGGQKIDVILNKI